MLSAQELGQLQSEQYAHDMRNHFDIVALHKQDRLKHYGLHFSKYVGRLARGEEEHKPIERTVTDTLLVALSAANALHQDLRKENFDTCAVDVKVNLFCVFADAAGRFADACEKIDHMEEFVPIARTANRDILSWVMAEAAENELDLKGAVALRRKELSERQFYIRD
jgi:hypothetical protein